jgi:ferrous iron transport protein B
MALNRMDEASRKGLAINVKALQHLLGIPVVPTVALMGQGLTQLFAAAAGAARSATCPRAAGAEPAYRRQPGGRCPPP